MYSLRETLKIYWLHLIGILLFALAMWRLPHAVYGIRTFLIALFGLLCVVASHEVADWTGRYGWTYQSFWTYPPAYVQFFGFVLLVGVHLFAF